MSLIHKTFMEIFMNNSSIKKKLKLNPSDNLLFMIKWITSKWYVATPNYNQRKIVTIKISWKF